MKALGGKWSKGDIIALLGVIAAVLAIPGMPKLFHWDSTDPSPQRQISDPRTNPMPTASSSLKSDRAHDTMSATRPAPTGAKPDPPSWGRIRTDVLGSYQSLNVVGLSAFGALQCEDKADGKHCRQAVEVTLQDADETRRCKIDEAGYVLVKNEWEPEGVLSQSQQCTDTGGK